MSTVVAAALCLLLVDVGAPMLQTRGAPAQSDDPRAAVEEAARAWRSEELSSEQLTARLSALGAPAEPHVVQLLVAARSAMPGDVPAPLPVTALVSTLDVIGGTASLAPLVEVLGSTSVEERAAAACAIGGLGSASGFVPLLAALDDESILVRVAAGASTLELAAAHPEFELVGALEARWSDCARRDQLGIVLGRWGTDEAREVLRVNLGWPRSESETLAALGGLWLCAEQGDGEAVLNLLRDTESTAVRRKACLLLGKLGHRPAVRDLIDLLTEEDRGVVHDAHWALVRITGQPLRADVELWENWWERSGDVARPRQSLR